MFRSEHLTKISDFLNEIGIPCKSGTVEDAFLPGILVTAGGLVIDEDRCYPGDVLHEAGHLAVMEPTARKAAEIDVGHDGGDEMAAQAWSFAAARHIGIPLEVLFHDDGYKGAAGWFREHFSGETPSIGVPMLYYLGMTNFEPAEKREEFDNYYPDMGFWLRQPPPIGPAAAEEAAAE